jgi:hypothetical protein
LEKSVLERIVEWNLERNLIKTPEDFDLYKDMSFITEELLEASTSLKSEEAREKAEALVHIIKEPGYTPTPEQIVDAFCDMIVFAAGSIRKLGYNPDIAMDEVIKVINSRTGTMINGKFT